ncbi:SOSS complex subunit C homolog [Planococcus citri]|uniref:SOSS complex subunit C homolog n=1 Tax=Planococcus citri TaxID=170843 RepID=UPI0031F80EDD
MAFTQQNKFQNRKIFEDLQQEKKILLKQGVPPLNTALPTALPPTRNVATNNDVHIPPVPHRPTLINAQSFGFFINQDSSFGNTILPVLPRFE